MFVPRYSADEARAAVQRSLSYAEALRRLGLCATGGNWQTLRKWTERWGIPTAHFDPRAARREAPLRPAQPLSEILVEGSTYSRNHLKARLYREGLKERRCEMCGVGELWHGRRMSLILDHINGVRDDHRYDNLRIVCPNCAATLDTHCGRKNRIVRPQRACLLCGETFEARFRTQRYCSRECGTRAPRPNRGVANPALRRIERPPYEQLLDEIAAVGYSAVGRRYGVSDNAIRKWVRQYEREASLAAAPADGQKPRATPPAGAAARPPPAR